MRTEAGGSRRRVLGVARDEGRGATLSRGRLRAQLSRGGSRPWVADLASPHLAQLEALGGAEE